MHEEKERITLYWAVCIAGILLYLNIHANLNRKGQALRQSRKQKLHEPCIIPQQDVSVSSPRLSLKTSPSAVAFKMAWIMRLQPLNPFDAYGNNGISICICIVHLYAKTIPLTRNCVCFILRIQSSELKSNDFDPDVQQIALSNIISKQITMLLILVSCFVYIHSKCHTHTYIRMVYSATVTVVIFKAHVNDIKLLKSVQNNLYYDNDVCCGGLNVFADRCKRKTSQTMPSTMHSAHTIIIICQHWKCVFFTIAGTWWCIRYELGRIERESRRGRDEEKWHIN